MQPAHELTRAAMAGLEQGALALTRAEPERPRAPEAIDRRFAFALGRLADCYPSFTPSGTFMASYWQALSGRGLTIGAVVEACAAAALMYPAWMPTAGQIQQLALARYTVDEVRDALSRHDRKLPQTFENLAILIEQRRNEAKQRVPQLPVHHEPDAPRDTSGMRPQLRALEEARLAKERGEIGYRELVAATVAAIDSHDVRPTPEFMSKWGPGGRRTAGK